MPEPTKPPANLDLAIALIAIEKTNDTGHSAAVADSSRGGHVPFRKVRSRSHEPAAESLGSGLRVGRQHCSPRTAGHNTQPAPRRRSPAVDAFACSRHGHVHVHVSDT